MLPHQMMMADEYQENDEKEHLKME